MKRFDFWAAIALSVFASIMTIFALVYNVDREMPDGEHIAVAVGVVMLIFAATGFAILAIELRPKAKADRARRKTNAEKRIAMREWDAFCRGARAGVNAFEQAHRDDDDNIDVFVKADPRVYGDFRRIDERVMREITDYAYRGALQAETKRLEQ